MQQLSELQKLRMQEKPRVPKILSDLSILNIQEFDLEDEIVEVKKQFHFTSNKKNIKFIKGQKRKSDPKNVGVLFSGGQAAGGHNVVIGLFDALKKLNPKSRLFGFLSGPDGLVKNEFFELNETILSTYLNQGGFDLLGSGRTKIESFKQFHAVAETVTALDLEGLVIIGGDDSNTNAAFLAEYFIQEKIKTQVIGVPKTIDGDLKNAYIQTTFGFDTACKTFSEIIGSIARDALSAKKYYHFVKLMGRSASHVTLECALQVHPNMTLISEEIERDKKTLKDIVTDICDMIVKRSIDKKDYGVILVPEGLLEYIQEMRVLISELSSTLKSDQLAILEMDVLESKSDRKLFIKQFLSKETYEIYASLPEEIQDQLLQTRDPHGNVQVSKIDTERFLIELVEKELKIRKRNGLYSGKFNPLPIFCGYEGRSCFPSHFDSDYCYALGINAALLVDAGITGYMAAVQNLTKDVSDWGLIAVPFLKLMHLEERQGQLRAVIKKAFVDLNGPLFKFFQQKRDEWQFADDYHYPGPIQFYGPKELTDKLTITLSKEGEFHVPL